MVVTAPAVFKFTAKSNPDRHRFAALLLGVDISNLKDADVGTALADGLLSFRSPDPTF